MNRLPQASPNTPSHTMAVAKIWPIVTMTTKTIVVVHRVPPFGPMKPEVCRQNFCSHQIFLFRERKKNRNWNFRFKRKNFLRVWKFFPVQYLIEKLRFSKLGLNLFTAAGGQYYKIWRLRTTTSDSTLKHFHFAFEKKCEVNHSLHHHHLMKTFENARNWTRDRWVKKHEANLFAMSPSPF